jgi:hypothetical protein
MCCYGKQARKFVSWLPEARSRSRGIQVKPDDVGDLGDPLGISREFERLGAPGRDCVLAPHPCHRAVAGPQMLGQQPRTAVCDTVFLRWRQRDQYRGCRGPGVRGRPERSSSDLTYPPSPERRTAGREVWSPSSCRPESPRRPSEGQAQKRRPDRSTNYLLRRGGSYLAVRAMLR